MTDPTSTTPATAQGGDSNRPFAKLRDEIAGVAKLESEQGRSFDIAAQVIDGIAVAADAEAVFDANEAGPKDIREYVGQPMTLMQVDYFKSSEQYAGSGLGTYVVVRVLFDNGDEEMFSTGAPNLVASFRQFERLGRIGGDNPIRLKITSKTTSAGELLRVARP